MILENYLIELLVLLYIIIYGGALGFRNITVRIINTIQFNGVRQSSGGQIADMALFTGIVYLWLWQPQFIDEVIAGIVW